MNIVNGNYTYYPDQVLGKGNFATVYLGKSNIDPKLDKVAVKVIDFEKVEERNKLCIYSRKMIENELSIVKLKLVHKNIIQYYDHDQ